MAKLSPKRLMNKSEERLFGVLCRIVADELGNEYHVFTQVSYGEIVQTKHKAAFRKFNAKRADFVIAGPDFFALAVIEYQGAGHWGNTPRSRRRANASDIIKRKVLRRAGIALIEIPANYDTLWLAHKLKALR